MSARLLVVDEHDRIAPTVLSALQRRFKVVRVAHAEEASGAGYDVAVIAPGADDQPGLCRRLIEIGAASEVVILGASPSLEDTIRAIRAQAFDFVPEGDEPSGW